MAIVEILGTQINAITMDQAVEEVIDFVAKGKFHHVVTPNPEMLLVAKDDFRFRKILNSADLRIPDGVGLKWLGGLPSRVSGIDLFLRLAEIGQKQGWKFYLLGGEENVAKQAGKILQQAYPGLRIVGVERGGRVGENGQGDQDDLVIGRINQAAADILLVCFGAPKQDWWIKNNSRRFSTIKIALGGGGTLDFITGRQKRAPKIMRELSLEWLWRLILEPRRIRRIFRAVVIFPLTLMLYKLGVVKLTHGDENSG